jgi:hypothetical protein
MKLRNVLPLLAALPAFAADIVLTHNTSIVLDLGEPPPVRKAVADLATDFAKVFGERGAPQGRTGTRIVIALNHNLPAGVARPNAPESFRIVANAPNTVVLTGADTRGTIYAIYEFSRRFLGVDPLYFWTDHDPPRRNEIRIPANTDIQSGTPAFRYRGWFINDEDLLTGWKPGKSDNTGIALEVWDRIFEALLRLRGNMIVPGTFIFPDEPQVRAAAGRGLMITQHHIEVLGTNTYRWPGDQPYSFTAAPRLLLNAWRNSANGYLPFQEVLWTLGYRGRHDRPFWEDDPSSGATEQDHARVIRQAIDAQIAIVRERSRNPYFIMNAWMEAVPMIRKGYLQIPEGVTLVWPDNGHGVIRDGGTIAKGQGVYYHTAMHDFMANQLTEMVPLTRIDRELGRAITAGATEYLLVNTSDIRPVVMTTRAVMELAWSGRADPDFLEHWSREEFGAESAKTLAEYYRAFLDAPGRFGAGETQTFGDCAYQTLARAILTKLITGKGTVDLPLMIKATSEAEPRWAAVRKLAEAASRGVPPARKDFYLSHVLTQLDIHEYSNRMLKHVAQGQLEAGRDDADRVLASFHASEYGKWAGFYSEELFANVRLTRALIVAAIDKWDGKPVPADLPVQSRTPDPYPFLKAYQGSRRVNTSDTLVQ